MYSTCTVSQTSSLSRRCRQKPGHLPGQQLIETHNTQAQQETFNSEVDSIPQILKNGLQLTGQITGN